MTTVSLAVAALIAAAPVNADVSVPFSSQLLEIRSAVLKTKAAQIRIKTPREIDILDNDIRRLGWDARRLRDRVSDLRRRAQRAASVPRRPGMPQQDPWIQNDLRRLVWDVRDFKNETERSARTAQRLAMSAGKDPDSVLPAETLVRNANALDSETGWLDSEARWARMDLQRAGYGWEAWDLEREADDSARASREIEREAATLLSRVR